MKVIDLSPIRPADNSLKRLWTQLEGISKFGYSWLTDLNAQEMAIRLMQNLFDNRYTMLRYVTLEKLDIPIPLILVGPAGIYVIYVSGVKGLFQAKGNTWSEMNRARQRYEPARQNLLQRAQLMARAVDAYLVYRKRPHPPLQAALVFPDPGTHVDTIRPEVRVVLRDGIERFASSVVQGKPLCSPEEVASYIEALAQQGEQVAKTVEVPAGKPDVFDLSEPPDAQSKPRPAPRPVLPLGKLNITPKQWMFLGIMAAAEVVILIVFAILFFSFLSTM